MPSPQIPQQSTSLEYMMKKLLDDQHRFHEELQQFSHEFPSLQNLETQFIQVKATFQNMLDEKELCNTQPISYSRENVNVDTLRNVEVNVDTLAAIETGVISERPEEPQIESKEDQPLIFYIVDTFMLEDHDMIDSFMLEVPNELPILKKGVHAALPKYVDAPFVVDISKGEGIA
ncbi:hypothetical protein Syun_014017 [Stephania yunnanensis]|uniref:Uncharacterized protein n=1 Tax=Stephania yunnanensis TaxID=152371 RepID=A0AAP0JKT9_9MAGN